MTRFLLFFSLLLLAAPAFAFEKATLTKDELTQLEQGDAIISVWKDREHEKKPTVSRGGIDITAPVSIVYNIMLNCDRMYEVSSDIRECIVMETSDDASWDIRKQKFAVSPILPKFNAIFKTEYSGSDAEGRTMVISKISGDLKVQDGRWDIMPLSDNRTRVIYQAAIKPSLPIPAKIIREQVGIGIPDILRNLRDVAEADYAEVQKQLAMSNDTKMP